VPFAWSTGDEVYGQAKWLQAWLQEQEITAETGITVTAARAGSRAIRRHKASSYPLPQPPG
jgi:hypothetical protein